MDKNQKLSLWFVITIFFVINVPILAMNGMFMDGLWYAAISKNLSHGLGTFWHPFFTISDKPSFHDHPPLVFGIEALFFKLLGTGFYTERLFAFTNGIVNISVLLAIWRRLFKDNLNLINWSSVGVLFWVINSQIIWGISNNTLENTMSIFANGAVLLLLIYMQSNKLQWLLYASLSIVLGFLCKGPTSLFPLAVPFIYTICYNPKKYFNGLAQSATLTFFSIGLFCGLLFFVPEAKNSFETYFKVQIQGSIAYGANVPHRWYILQKTAETFIPALLLILILWYFTKNKVKEIIAEREMWFVTLIGLSALLPITVSMKQGVYYGQCSYTFFAIALGALSAPMIASILADIPKLKITRFLQWGIAIVVCLTFLASVYTYGKPRREKDMLHDIALVNAVIGNDTTLQVNKDMHGNFQLRGYMQRMYATNIDNANKPNYQYLMLPKDSIAPLNYKVINLETTIYKLYKKM